ncbi:MAG: nitrate reductase cytochrome c-type subunit [Gammaproteobacteria bacterium]|nr:nitrate reductase cytochrome c-type subunit [Gammaproteobacteria bacterium]
MKPKKYLIILAAIVGVSFILQSPATELGSLRGPVEIDQDTKAPEIKKYPKDGEPIARDYVQQPPLVPHSIDRYKINVKSNKCLGCHSWKNYRQYDATKISQTHFEDRDANVLANVSARRYFCTQCHVPQVNAKPLVENEFKPVTAISGE